MLAAVAKVQFNFLITYLFSKKNFTSLNLLANTLWFLHQPTQDSIKKTYICNMKLNEIRVMLAKDSFCKSLACLVEKGPTVPVYLNGLQGSAAAAMWAALPETKVPVVFILNDEDDAGYFYHDLSILKGEELVLFLPSGYRRSVKYARRDDASEILRTDVLSRLSTNAKGLFIVTFPEALSVKVAPQKELGDNSFILKVGESQPLDKLQEKLVGLGFCRTDYVYEPGQFSVRGSIVDIFSYSLEYPLRMDFFGNEIDSIRTFEVESQLSREKRSEAVIAASVEESSVGRVPFWDYIPQDSLVVMRNPDFIRDSLKQIYKEGFARQAEIENEELHEDERKDSELDKKKLLYDGEDWEKRIAGFRKFILGTRKSEEAGTELNFKTHPQPLFHKNMDMLAQSLKDYKQKGYTIYILADDEGQQDRLKTILDGMDAHIGFKPVQGTLQNGFVDDTLKVCLFTDHQIFDRFHRYSLRSERARGGKTSLTLKELREFEPGDYVVHLDHGVGRFEGLVQVQTGDKEQEMMKLTYQGGDIVYVSIHALNKVSKYKGKEGEMPRLNKLGTGAWDRMKDRTKKRIKDIARDLIKLYAQRRKEQGFKYQPDSYMQQELEASFEYEDTPDQASVSQEIKKDMESGKPMDRLICGDVGFGKTELAVRAAFKAAADSKQVAVLVPTTVLVYQHYQTFSKRLKDFPVTIAYLTRAQNAAKATEIREGLSKGKVDIVIGTQKLLGKNIIFKDLGLLIVDEEQKFGVATKEKLRKMRVNVDTLAMSATPIPRTLQFSLMGARDLSVLHTPPANRLPIHTEIHLFGHEVICDAINFELTRYGQVFIVCNRIAELPNLEEMIHKYVPDARVAIGHGQMSPEKLEKIIFDFINHEYDVLISTTIIENGIDIPNANTIIIVDSQRYGLSDLHQMRGRVGRSSRKAFCYLLAPPFASMTSEARRRLEAVENFSELGSGLQIAMQDLDIRGAGNLLGAEQSGFIADLGYETYQKVLSEAVTELKNDEFSDIYSDDERSKNELRGETFVDDCQLDCDLPLFFAENYIPGSAERMDCYRQLDNVVNDTQLADFRKQLEDRFGPLPHEAEQLLKVSELRRIGRSLGIERVVLKHSKMTLYFVSNRNSAFYESSTFGRTITYLKRNILRGSLKDQNGHLKMAVNEVPGIEEAINVFQQISQQEPS